MKNLDLIRKVRLPDDVTFYGKVTKIVGLTIEADGPLLGIGTRCVIENGSKKGCAGRNYWL